MAEVLFQPTAPLLDTHTPGELQIYNSGTHRTDIPKQMTVLDIRSFSDPREKIQYDKFWVRPSNPSTYSGLHSQGAVFRAPVGPDGGYIDRFGQSTIGTTGIEAIIYLRTYRDGPKCGQSEFLYPHDPIAAVFTAYDVESSPQDCHHIAVAS